MLDSKILLIQNKSWRLCKWGQATFYVYYIWGVYPLVIGSSSMWLQESYKNAKICILLNTGQHWLQNKSWILCNQAQATFSAYYIWGIYYLVIESSTVWLSKIPHWYNTSHVVWHRKALNTNTSWRIFHWFWATFYVYHIWGVYCLAVESPLVWSWKFSKNVKINLVLDTDQLW